MISGTSYFIPKRTCPSSGGSPTFNDCHREPSSPSGSTSDASNSSAYDISPNLHNAKFNLFQQSPPQIPTKLELTDNGNNDEVTPPLTPSSADAEQPDDSTVTTANEELPLVNVACPTKDDILCGRGKGPQNHPGNVFFRERIVAPKRLTYATTFGMSEKRAIIGSIIKEVRARGARFLQLDTKTGLWSDIGDRRAHLKTAQALRECTQYKRKLDEIVVNARRCNKDGSNAGVTGDSNTDATNTDEATVITQFTNSPVCDPIAFSPDVQTKKAKSRTFSNSSSSSSCSLALRTSLESYDGARVKVEGCGSPIAPTQEDDTVRGTTRSPPLEEAPGAPPRKRKKSTTSMLKSSGAATTMQQASDVAAETETETESESHDDSEHFIEASDLFESVALAPPVIGDLASNAVTEEETTITSGDAGSAATVLGMPWVHQNAASLLDPSFSPMTSVPLSEEDKPSQILRKVSSDNSSANSLVGLDRVEFMRHIHAGPPTDIVVFLKDCIKADEECDIALDDFPPETKIEEDAVARQVVEHSHGDDDVSLMSSFSYDRSGELKLDGVENDHLSGSTFPTFCPDDRAKMLSFSPFEDDVDCVTLDRVLGQMEAKDDDLQGILPLDDW